MSRDFNPYVDNGGTVLAIGGKDFVLICSDTRLSEGYSILSRDVPKTFPITDKIVLGSSGMRADIERLTKLLKIKCGTYKHNTGRDIGVTQFAQLLSTTLYQKRFFPFYTFNVVAGIDTTDKEHQGAIFTYDAVGSMQRRPYAVSGSGEHLIIGVLDMELKTMLKDHPSEDLTQEAAMELAKRAFDAAVEREISTGDTLQMHVITAAGSTVSRVSLRKD